MIVVIDNFDSFTYNIVHAFQELGEKVSVVRQLGNLKPDALVIGPGPGHPSARSFPLNGIPTLGICLGHQWLGLHFGAKIKRTIPHHGKQSKISHLNTGLFKDLPQNFLAVRYHSLVLEDLPSCLELTAWTEEGEMMGLAHKTLPYVGVQFHPDSISTEYGKEIFSNFLKMVRVESHGRGRWL